MTRGRKFVYMLALVIVARLGAAHGASSGTESISGKNDSSDSLLDEIKSGFYSRINAVGFGVVQRPIESVLNPDNALGIVDYQTELDLRPDFNLKYRRLELAFKPRLDGKWQKWLDGTHEGSEGHAEAFVQEWLVRYRVMDPLFISYGRENLQWGPSYLLSASNPFNPANGRNNPQLEVPGLGYGQVLWVPSTEWSVSFIANTDKGRLQLPGAFRRTYALKLDYIGAGKYFSLIPSYRESGQTRMGFYGGWTLSDAALLYTEGQLSAPGKNPRVLVGGSYTFQLGPTLGLEYFRNSAGCDRKPFVLCFVPGASGQISTNSPLQQEQDFFRKNYFSLQYLQTRIGNVFDLTLQWVRNLDDTSNRFLAIFSYEIGEHTQLFMINNVLEGGTNTEFRSVVGYSLMMGVSYTF